MPLGKVVGQFRIESILSDEPESLWKRRKNTQVFLSNFMTHIIQVEKRPTAIKLVKWKDIKNQFLSLL